MTRYELLGKTEEHVMKARAFRGVTRLPVKSSAAGRLPASQPAYRRLQPILPDYKLLSF